MKKIYLIIAQFVTISALANGSNQFKANDPINLSSDHSFWECTQGTEGENADRQFFQVEIQNLKILNLKINAYSIIKDGKQIQDSSVGPSVSEVDVSPVLVKNSRQVSLNVSLNNANNLETFSIDLIADSRSGGLNNQSPDDPHFSAVLIRSEQSMQSISEGNNLHISPFVFHCIGFLSK